MKLCSIFEHRERVSNAADTDSAIEFKTWWGCDDLEAPNSGVMHSTYVEIAGFLKKFRWKKKCQS